MLRTYDPKLTETMTPSDGPYYWKLTSYTAPTEAKVTSIKYSAFKGSIISTARQ